MTGNKCSTSDGGETIERDKLGQDREWQGHRKVREVLTEERRLTKGSPGRALAVTGTGRAKALG